MTFRVVFTSNARLQLTQAARWWAENRSIEQAARWLEGFDAAISALADSPEKHGLARENNLSDFTYPVHQLLYGLGTNPTHRAMFEVRVDTVYVVAVRHLAQQDITPEDLGYSGRD